MKLNDWLMLTSILCLILGTVYMCYSFRKMIVSIEVTRKEIEKQTKQLVRHRAKAERG